MLRAVLRLNRYSTNSSKMVKKACIFLGERAEETEVVIPVDTLRRAGVEVTIAGVNGCEPVTCVEHTRLVPDVEIERLQNETFDVVILPGGPGWESLKNNKLVEQMVKKHSEQNKIIAAICAGTKLLDEFKINYGSRITTYPMYMDVLEKNFKYSDERVVCDGNLITSQGPGTAFEFALTIVKTLYNQDKAKQLAVDLRVNNF